MGDSHPWTPEQKEFFLQACIEEVTRSGRKGLSLQKESWAKVGKAVNEKFNLDLNQRQLKNCHDNLKAKFSGWLYLKNKTGNLYNPQTNTFTLTPEEWADFKKGHPKAMSLRTTPMPFIDLCTALFEGSSATGEGRWTSSQTTSVHESSSILTPLQLTDIPTVALDDDDDTTSHHTSEPQPDAPPNKRAKPSTSRARSTSASPTSASTKASITGDELALDMQKALRHLINGPIGHTVPQCLEKLELLELGPIDPLRFAAYHIFGGTLNMREMWINLPNDPDILKGWIAMTGTSLGVLKDGKIVR